MITLYRSDAHRSIILSYPKVATSTLDNYFVDFDPDKHEKFNTYYKFDELHKWDKKQIHCRNVAEITDNIPPGWNVYLIFREPLERYVTGFTFYLDGLQGFFRHTTMDVTRNIPGWVGKLSEVDLENLDNNWFIEYIDQIYNFTSLTMALDHHTQRCLFWLFAVHASLYNKNKIEVIEMSGVDNLIKKMYDDEDLVIIRSNETKNNWNEIDKWYSPYGKILRKKFNEAFTTELNNTDSERPWVKVLREFLELDILVYNFYIEHTGSEIPPETTLNFLKKLSVLIQENSTMLTAGTASPLVLGDGEEYSDLIVNWAVSESNPVVWDEIYPIAYYLSQYRLNKYVGLFANITKPVLRVKE